jgi:hypothetical protein
MSTSSPAPREGALSVENGTKGVHAVPEHAGYCINRLAPQRADRAAFLDKHASYWSSALLSSWVRLCTLMLDPTLWRR